MSEPKFKSGDKVWSVRHGVLEVANVFTADTFFPVVCNYERYTAAGKYSLHDRYPSLYTLDEARKLGFPVPEEPRFVWINIYPGATGWYAFQTREMADSQACMYRDRIGPARKFVEVKE